MDVSKRPAIWPRLVAVSLIGWGAAGCSSDSGRFSDIFSDNPQRTETTGSIQQRAPAGRVESQPMPRLAGADGQGMSQGMSGGGRGMGSYQPAGTEVTGSLPPAPPPPVWSWEGGTPITVAPGETLETISRQHGVPVGAIMQANNISSPSMVRPGQHLVIPRRLSTSVAYAPPATRVAAAAPVPTATMAPAPMAVGSPRMAIAPTAGVHVVAPGETLHSIARLYSKPVLVLAKANNIAPDTMVRVGDRIVIPDVRGVAAPRAPAVVASVPQRVQAPLPAAGPELATAESPHSARLVEAEAPPAAQDNSVKTAEPAGNLPGFRWPVRGRIIAAFGPKPNGLQNDGINLAVPEGTPVKAAEDGVVAYAGNELKGYGNLVLVRHPDGFVTAYAHTSEILVKRGEQVKRGQVIAKSGQTGNVTSPQLHFEIRKGATPVDPAQYLNGA
jgi:murein DD-endopeptidase MepM/ murein hydrolase activator NlpD